MKCPLCKNMRVLIENRNIEDHMIVTLNSDGHVHVHAPLKNKEIMDKFLVAIDTEIKKSNNLSPDNILSYPISEDQLSGKG